MSEKNADVDRALAAFGGASMTYHSFGPFTMRPRTSADTRAFTYNELGEAHFVPQQPASLAAPAAPTEADALYDTLPVVQPPLPRPAAAASGPIPAPPVPRTSAPRPAARVASVQQPAAPVQPPAPPPPPFFPLLAAALPNASEPTYTPTYPTAPPPSYAPPPAAPPSMASESAAGSAAPGAIPSGAMGGVAESADRRSLTEMFRLLSGRADGAPAAPSASAAPGAAPQPAAPAGNGQSLFRRI